MLKETIEKALNQQINRELYSSYLYLSMSTYLDTIDLTGASHWMKTQAQEELTHAMKIYDYILERDGRVVLESINQPPKEWDSGLAAFEAAYQHEQNITEAINNLVSLAIDEKDHATNSFLQWFVTEQVEEESTVKEVIQRLSLVGESGNGIFMVDRELAQRTFTPADQNSEA